MPPAEYYSKTGRGYPDLAAVSNHYWVVNNKMNNNESLNILLVYRPHNLYDEKDVSEKNSLICDLMRKLRNVI